ncbi:uncharacterized protein V1516DRAFT_619019 [Lipomyces oligophaga]|uniref:uncharacterized protein n=1 Tax=Lipomyces oligophaga TaxID=45792 RepID=UPI0034CF7080
MAAAGVSLDQLPKSHVFTKNLPSDPMVPTPEASMNVKDPRLLLPRAVTDAAYTFVAPDTHDLSKAQILAVSDAALKDLGLALDVKNSLEFKELVIGNKIYEEHYPWAHLYGGYQFGQWAGQLGDGRAISLFEATNPDTGHRYEVQLKGAGRTPYSRFADGKAVLRSSIREFLVSEALNALSIPTTRALALSRLTNEGVRREAIEPRAIVTRMAESWIRFGSFDIHRRRGDRKMIKLLADYVLDYVYQGLDHIVSQNPEFKGLGRYHVLYREVARRTAETTALLQAYGFMNGVMNTDNTSIIGLSMDYGPFAFMDIFDPSYTPNHDDGMLRYSYRNMPTVMLWNLVRLGEALAELFAAADPAVLDTTDYFENGFAEDELDAFVQRAETMIDAVGEYYRATYERAHSQAFIRRLGLLSVSDTDSRNGIVDSVLELMKTHALDFHHFFRRLANVQLFATSNATDGEFISLDRIEEIFLTHDRGRAVPSAEDSSREIRDWLLNVYKPRLVEESNTDDVARKIRMDAVNPNFVLRGWILSEVIDRVQRQNDDAILEHVLELSLDPFRDSWTDESKNPEKYARELRYTGNVPRGSQGLMCSCSS